MSRPESRPARDQGRRPVLAWAEWVVAGLGAAFLVGALGYLAWQAATRDDAPPAIFVSALSVTRVGQGYAVRFEARNEGDLTAAGLVVKGQLRRGGEIVEEAEATLDYAPAHSSREGALVFENDPAAFQLVLGAAGYHDP